MTGPLESAISDILKSVLREVAREVAREFLPLQSSVNKEDKNTGAAAGRMLLRKSEVAEMLAISERLLFSLTSSGELPSVRVGSLVRYSAATIQEWISRNESAENQPRRPHSSQPQAIRVRNDTPRPPAKKVTPTKNAKAPRKKQAAEQSATINRGPAHRREAVEVTPNSPRSVRVFFAKRLGIDESAFPQMTNGDIMRIAGIDIPTLHGWAYRGGEMPDAAIRKLDEYFLSLTRKK